MSGPRLDALLRCVRQAVGPDSPAGPTDGELLRRFVADRDAAAFEALLRRHGPMVLGVCRRALRDAHRAEDAFQATFLVLVRRAGSIRRRESVGSWLHGVARRVAARAWALSERDSARGGPAVERAAAPTDGEALWELRPVLDDELQRLPEHYRAPLVLHYLEGKTKAQAARELGWKEGTLSGRLARARELLRRRLTRRGLAPSAAALALALPAALRAEVPAALAAAVGKAAPLAAVGEASLAAAVSSEVLHMMKGACRAMGSIKATAVMGVLLALLGAGVGLAACLPRGGPDVQPVWTPLDREAEHGFLPIRKEWAAEVSYFRPNTDPPNAWGVVKPEDRDPKFEGYFKEVEYFSRAGDKRLCKFMRYYPSGALYMEVDNYWEGDNIQDQFGRSFYSDGAARSYWHWREGLQTHSYSVSPDGRVRHRVSRGEGEDVDYGLEEGNRIHRWYHEGAQFLEKRFKKGVCVEVHLDLLRGKDDDWLRTSRNLELLTLRSQKEGWERWAGRPPSHQTFRRFDEGPGPDPGDRDPEEEKRYLSLRDEFLKDYGDLLKKAGKSWKGLGIDFVRTGEKWPD
jgi:RNA polymerase sigma factor (sigma-70 family)